MLSSPRGTPNHLRQGMYFSVQSLPSHVDASKLQNQPESMPSNSGIPPSSVSTMQTMISVQGPSLPPEFQQSIPDLPSKSIPEIPSVLKEPSSLSTTRHNSVDVFLIDIVKNRMPTPPFLSRTPSYPSVPPRSRTKPSITAKVFRSPNADMSLVIVQAVSKHTQQQTV